MKLTVKYGLTLGGVLSAMPLIYFALGIEKAESIQTVSALINVVIIGAIIFIGIREVRAEQENGYLSFGKGFSAGMTMSAIAGLLSAAFSYIYFTWINPGMVTYIKMKQEEEMLKRGLSESDVEKMAPRMEFWTNPEIMSVFAFLSLIVLGLVASLICAALLKKDDPSELIS